MSSLAPGVHLQGQDHSRQGVMDGWAQSVGCFGRPSAAAALPREKTGTLGTSDPPDRLPLGAVLRVVP